MVHYELDNHTDACLQTCDYGCKNLLFICTDATARIAKLMYKTTQPLKSARTFFYAIV